MASSWGVSWGIAWGAAFGVVAGVAEVQTIQDAGASSGFEYVARHSGKKFASESRKQFDKFAVSRTSLVKGKDSGDGQVSTAEFESSSVGSAQKVTSYSAGVVSEIATSIARIGENVEYGDHGIPQSVIQQSAIKPVSDDHQAMIIAHDDEEVALLMILMEAA